MTLNLVFTLALLVFTTTGALAQTAPELRSFMESQVPAPDDFHRFLQRDMNAFFSTRLKKTVEVEYQLFSDVFSDVPSQPEWVFPSYYARVRMTEGGTLVEDGAVIVSAFQRTRFQVMWYVSTAMARENFGSVTRAFPAEMAKKMYADMNPLDERRDRQDSLCARVPSQKERSERLAGRDPRESSRHGYPEGDPIVWYQKARENGNMRDASSAITLVQIGAGTKKDLGRADELWRDYWCAEVLPAFANRPDIVLVSLTAAAKRGLPSAMRRLSEVYAEGQLGQAKNSDIAAQWKSKAGAAR